MLLNRDSDPLRAALRVQQRLVESDDPNSEDQDDRPPGTTSFRTSTSITTGKKLSKSAHSHLSDMLSHHLDYTTHHHQRRGGEGPAPPAWHKIGTKWEGYGSGRPVHPHVAETLSRAGLLDLAGHSYKDKDDEWQTRYTHARLSKPVLDMLARRQQGD